MQGLPVVRMARDAARVDLLARSADEYIHRALCEEDAAGGSGGCSAAAAGQGLYEGGAFAASGLPSLDSYLTRSAGMYPDVVERLALRHLEKGDNMSALITAEWWGYPPAVHISISAADLRADTSLQALASKTGNLLFAVQRHEKGLCEATGACTVC